jgi:uncharacterized membrane protein
MSRRTLPLGAFFVGAGTLHFARPRMYEAIMPPYVPAHREMVLLSGAAEIAGGAAALHPRSRRAARWGLTATMLAVFPANLHMALNPGDYRRIPPALLYARVPLQAAIIAWIFYATSDD